MENFSKKRGRPCLRSKENLRVFSRITGSKAKSERGRTEEFLRRHVWDIVHDLRKAGDSWAQSFDLDGMSKTVLSELGRLYETNGDKAEVVAFIRHMGTGGLSAGDAVSAIREKRTGARPVAGKWGLMAAIEKAAREYVRTHADADERMAAEAFRELADLYAEQ